MFMRINILFFLNCDSISFFFDCFGVISLLLDVLDFFNRWRCDVPVFTDEFGIQLFV